MNIATTLAQRHSKQTTLQIVNWIGEDQQRFAEFLPLFLHGEKQVVQRASWVMSFLGERSPALLAPHWSAIMTALENPVHDAVSRNILKVIANAKIDLPEEEEGRMVHIAFEALANPKTPVAIQAQAMTCLANLLPKYPELADELRQTITEGMEYGSAGYCARGRAVLQQIAKLPNS
ncbi:MAG: hypothetical protein AAGJ82_03970 [Bacteroidota bacterium]